MSIFKCLDDPATGPRLQTIGITDADLVRYIINRAKGQSENEAVFTLLGRYDPDLREAEFIRAIVAQFPLP